MKSKFLKYLFVTGLGLTMILFSCTKLDEKVYSELIAEQFNPTESDVASVMGPIYSNLRNVVAGWAGLYDVVEESSDLIVTPVRPNGWDDGHRKNIIRVHCGAEYIAVLPMQTGHFI
jgi:starch-binding outer membrane protein, SusD/RagB family